MRNIWLDFETYYDNEYSLRKMTPIEYILDPRFEALGCSFYIQSSTATEIWIDGPNLPAFFAGVDWSECRVISHNAMFDMLILAMRYDIHPAAYGCTLSMARNWIRHQIGKCGLEQCAKRYMMEKGKAIYHTKGVSFAALKADDDLYEQFTEYCCNDTRICRMLWYNFLHEGFPIGELDVIDWTIRMVVQPALEIDLIRVAEHLSAVKAQKQQLLEAAGLEDRSSLMSDELLAGILIELGVDPPPMKVSPSTDEAIWAFAKTDLEFTDLQNHEDPKVQAVVAARLGHRSTIEESRAERFMAISHMTEAMPIPLRYSGAHTHRFSGDWSLNMQNLPNGSKLREAIRAPKGCVVVSVDASQIEARLNATLSGEAWLVEAFKEGRDVYSEFATDIYNKPVSKGMDERKVGKVGILSLGYGSAWMTFQRMVRNQTGIVLTDDDATRIVTLYRNVNAAIVDHWSEAKEVILMIEQGVEAIWGSLRIEREALVLPNGNRLRYHNLRKEQLNGFKKQWVYDQGPLTKRLYGAKVVENECQSLAFLHIAEVAMRVKKLTDGMLLPCHQIHDELLYCVPETMGEKVKQLVIQEMSTSPEWLPDAPLAAEGHIGETYGGAK